jgi:hypothetical protein
MRKDVDTEFSLAKEAIVWLKFKGIYSMDPSRHHEAIERGVTLIAPKVPKPPWRLLAAANLHADTCQKSTCNSFAPLRFQVQTVGTKCD